MANIEIYIKATCPFSLSCKGAVKQQGREFREIAIDGDAVKREEMIKRSGRTTVPGKFFTASSISRCDDFVCWMRVVGRIRCCVKAYQVFKDNTKGFWLHMSEQNNTGNGFPDPTAHTAMFRSAKRTACFPERLAAEC